MASSVGARLATDAADLLDPRPRRDDCGWPHIAVAPQLRAFLFALHLGAPPLQRAPCRGELVALHGEPRAADGAGREVLGCGDRKALETPKVPATVAAVAASAVTMPRGVAIPATHATPWAYVPWRPHGLRRGRCPGSSSASSATLWHQCPHGPLRAPATLLPAATPSAAPRVLATPSGDAIDSGEPMGYIDSFICSGIQRPRHLWRVVV